MERLNKSNKTFLFVLPVLANFGLYYVLSKFSRPIKLWLDEVTGQGLVSYILTYFLIGLPLFISTFLMCRRTSILKSLGISSGLLKGVLLGVLFTLPMFVGGAIFFQFNRNLDMEQLLAGTLVAGFMEELYYRGFLFGLLFRKTSLGFIPSILIGALIFASGHLYQSQNSIEMLGIFLITFSGAVFFAWLYVEWQYNLWVPIATHTLMNLSWAIFQIDNSALGSMQANIFRALTIAIAIAGTIVYKRRMKTRLTINRDTLLLKSRDLTPN